MSRCSNGHDSSTDDYCDVCGVPIGTGSAPAAPAPAGSRPAAPAPGGSTPCGNCGQPMLAGARFCEQCGWDAEAATLGGGAPPPLPPEVTIGQPPPAAAASVVPAAWQVLAVADRSYFDTVRAMDGADVSSLTFPVYWPARRFPLTGERALIGRTSQSRDTHPEIDLGGQFTDPGVSSLHAVLVAQPDGTWTIADLGSSNGTYLNESLEPLEPHVPVPVGEADKIHIGAWTTLTLQRDSA